MRRNEKKNKCNLFTKYITPHKIVHFLTLKKLFELLLFWTLAGALFLLSALLNDILLSISRGATLSDNLDFLHLLWSESSREIEGWISTPEEKDIFLLKYNLKIGLFEMKL